MAVEHGILQPPSPTRHSRWGVVETGLLQKHGGQIIGCLKTVQVGKVIVAHLDVLAQQHFGTPLH